MKPLRPLLLVLLSSLASCDSSDSVAPERGGTIRVSLALGGLDLDPDGALVQLDGRTPVAVMSGGSVAFDATPGTHRLGLTGLAVNCAIAAGESRLVEVEEGSFTDAVFTARCVASSGVIKVSVALEGTGLDPDGFLIAVDSGPPQRILGGSTVGFAPINGGLHSVMLSEVARNCTVVGDNPVTGVQVRTGTLSRDTVRVTVKVQCLFARGSLRLITSTSGPPDANGYVIAVGSPDPQTYRLAPNDTLLLPGLNLNILPLSILDVAGNCGLVAPVPSSATITNGDTTVARFTVACVAPAVLRVSAPTSGSSIDPGYTVQVDTNSTTRALMTGATLSLDLTPGSHTILLGDVAPNCTVAGANPATVQLSTAAATDLVFPVTCSAIPRTGIDLIVTTTGPDQPLGYTIGWCNASDNYNCWYPAGNDHTFVAANSTLQIEVPVGLYYMGPTNSPENCRLIAPIGLINVVAGQVTTAHLDMTCAALADFEATVEVSGSDPPEGFYLVLDGHGKGFLARSVPTRFSSFEGDHTLEFSGIPANCHPVSDNPLRVSFTAGALTPVHFEMACEPWPIVQISVNSSGINVPTSYFVIIDPDPVGGLPAFFSPITANGTISTKVYPASHEVWLDQVPSNCSVSGPNPVTVNGGLGSTTEVTFLVTCR